MNFARGADAFAVPVEVKVSFGACVSRDVKPKPIVAFWFFTIIDANVVLYRSL